MSIGVGVHRYSARMSEQSSPFTSARAGQAFLVSPPGGAEGPGVLVLHSWWGLNDWTRQFCRDVAKEGYTVLAPDLLAGKRPMTEAEGEVVLAETDANVLSGLVMSSAHTLRAASANANKPIAAIGFSMGASMALWLATKLPDVVGAVITFYGSQSIDFDHANAFFQGHYASDDHLVSEEDRVTTEAFIRLGENPTDFHLYEGAKHWFFESGDQHNPQAAELAWQRCREFLAKTIGPRATTTPRS